MAKIRMSLKDNILNKKEVNHIVRYCDKIEYLLENISTKCFQPSYCKEIFNNQKLLIPMVSFCNILLRDVENYMYYGDYGLGFNIDWAIRNKISPVIYTHDTSEILNLFKIIGKNLTLLNLDLSINKIKNDIQGYSNIFNNKDSISDLAIKDIFNGNIKTIQFTKPWKSKMKFEIEIISNGKITCIDNEIDINCYNEREWRFVPNFNKNEFDNIIMENDSIESHNKYTKYTDSKKEPKPHIRQIEYGLTFDLNDLRYIIVRDSNEVQKVINVLNSSFNQDQVYENIKNGKLLILTKDSLRNDF
jgi:hypothetical protein